MVAKIVFAFCVQALLVQFAFTQCISRGPVGPMGPIGPVGPIGPMGPMGPMGPIGLGYESMGYAAGCGAVASTGGGFPVTSVSPIAPTGITIISENAIEGPLAVGGNLPFLGTVALEGVLPTAGAGTVSYGCGSGAVGITSEGPIATGIVGPVPYGGLPAGPTAYAGLPAGSAAYAGLPAGPAAYAGIPAPAAAYGPGLAGYAPGMLGAPAYGIAGYSAMY